MFDHSRKGFDPVTRGIVRRKARQLVGRAGLTPSDQDDLEHQLLLKLWKQMKSFDAGHAHWNVFVTTVVERHAASLVRDQRAGKRDHRRVTSLNAMIQTDGEGWTELAATVGQREHANRLGRRQRREAERVELALDVRTFVAALPPALRDLAERLQHQSLAEIARERGVPRTTLQTQLRQLRRRCERAGLQEYLG